MRPDDPPRDGHQARGRGGASASRSARAAPRGLDSDLLREMLREAEVYSDDKALSDGTLKAQIAAGEGYTLGDPSGLKLRLIDNDGGSKPEVSVTASGDITEGSDATFTVSASPTPAANLDVSVTVSAAGDFGATTGQQTVTIPTGGSVTMTVATTGDDTEESDGSVTATVNAGSDYTVQHRKAPPPWSCRTTTPRRRTTTTRRWWTC